MAKSGYSAQTEAAVALAGATAKTILGVVTPAQFGCDLHGLWIGFDGVTATDKSVLIEIGTCTFASNAPGTNSTSGTVSQVYGRSITAGFTTGYNWTTEPTVITVVHQILLSPQGGTLAYDFPFDETFDCAVSNGFVIRCTAPTNAVNVRAALRFERT